MKKFFEKLANHTTIWVGSTNGIIVVLISMFIWLIAGIPFLFSDSWQLVANSISTLYTTIIVALLQRTQNKDSIAIQMKLNELIACHERASNRLLNIENLPEAEIARLRKRYKLLATVCKGDESMTTPHTVEEIEDED